MVFRNLEFDKKDKKKNEFLDLIDDALINKQKEDDLKKIINNFEEKFKV